MISYQGTINGVSNFNAERAATKLHRAMRGIGSDERVIIEVLTNHSNYQRQEVKQQYKSMYKRSLAKELKEELGGLFEDTCLALLKSHAEHRIDCLYNAVKDTGVDEKCIVETLCLQTGTDLKELHMLFKTKYNKDLDDYLFSKVNEGIRPLIKALLIYGREPNTDPDLELAENDAQDLAKTEPSTWVAQNSIFLKLLTSRNPIQQQLAFQAYKRNTNSSVADTINSKFSGPTKEVYVTVAKLVEDPSQHFAKELRGCLQGTTTNDDKVINILVSRSEFQVFDEHDAD
ncbi:annexin A4-like isoform X2 [Limulus polyphemus]|uniref:Annexin A4-like isoform X2 n=1 Tax=Limulus polyphemus TaxID=6850 RepID=A0ABM1ST56_LIMPO|nr:annexin A4-like isoform X2 [Limulus polyphemus]